jgi:hypothetical protein
LPLNNGACSPLACGLLATIFADYIITGDKEMKKRKIKIGWSCSGYRDHFHRFKFMATLCGKIQMATPFLDLIPKYIWFAIILGLVAGIVSVMMS